MNYQLENPTPLIFANELNQNTTEMKRRKQLELNQDIEDPIDNYEIFDLIKNIKDPEHPLTLEQLHIVQANDISVNNENIEIYFTPTIPHCSLAQTIGLTIRVKLARCLPQKYKVSIKIKPTTHYQEQQINKQIADKERIQAAMENQALVNIVNHGISG